MKRPQKCLKEYTHNKVRRMWKIRKNTSKHKSTCVFILTERRWIIILKSETFQLEYKELSPKLGFYLKYS